MIVTDIILSPDMEEKILYDKPLLQHSLYEVPYDHYKRPLIPWHWHGEIELLYLNSGSCRYQTLETAYELNTGDAIYLSPGMLHQFEPLCPGTVSYANLFQPEFLTGRSGSYWDASFVSPLANQTEAIVLRKDDPAAAHALDLIRGTIRLCREEPPCYELLLRNALSEIWIDLYERALQRQDKAGKPSLKDMRLKKMLLFIGERYREPLSVAEIAQAAEVSERECYRLFRESLRQTPISFVQQYRLQQAAALLASGTGTITQIAGKVGFDSSAYFSKVFKQAYGITPMQMKKGHMAGSL